MKLTLHAMTNFPYSCDIEHKLITKTPSIAWPDIGPDRSYCHIGKIDLAPRK